MKIALAVILLAACSESSDFTQPDAPPADDVDSYPSIGKDGQAGFSLEFGPATRAIAEGATAGVFGAVRGTAPHVEAITADNPSILEISRFDPGESTGFVVNVKGASAGDTDLVLRDVNGAEIDRVTLHVRPSDTLAIQRPWGDGDALVLAGEVERWTVTTMTAGVVTAGTGAAQFTTTGNVSAATSSDAPWFFGFGDQVYFRAGDAGPATLTAQAPDTTAAVTLSVVEPTALTAMTVAPTTLAIHGTDQGSITVGATAGNVGVYGVRCTWSNVPNLTITLDSVFGDGHDIFLQTGWIGSDPSFTYSFKGSPGTYKPVCTLPGGLATAVTVTISG